MASRHRIALVALAAAIALGCAGKAGPAPVLEAPVAVWTDADLGLSGERVSLGEVVEGALVRHDLGGLGDLWTTHITTWKSQYALVAREGPPTVPDFIEPGGRRLGGRQRPVADADDAWGFHARAHRIRARVVGGADSLHPVLADLELLDGAPGEPKIADLIEQTHARFATDAAAMREGVLGSWKADGVTPPASAATQLRLALDPEAGRWQLVWIGSFEARTPAGTREVQIGCPECPCTPDGRCAPCIPCSPYMATVASTQVDRARWAVRYEVALDGSVVAVTRYAPRLSREIVEQHPRPGLPRIDPPPPAPR